MAIEHDRRACQEAKEGDADGLLVDDEHVERGEGCQGVDGGRRRGKHLREPEKEREGDISQNRENNGHRELARQAARQRRTENMDRKST